jgi:UDPglucose--hexose-1-phosphate uridylyltransferase
MFHPVRVGLALRRGPKQCRARIVAFEILLIRGRSVSGLAKLTAEERTALAEILRQTTIRYDDLFQTSFPNTMGFHQRPTDGRAYPEFHLHAHFYPQLLRSATVKKFVAGYEMLGMPQHHIRLKLRPSGCEMCPAEHYFQAVQRHP